MVGPSSVIPDPASLHLPCNPASFSLLFGLGRGSSKSLPRNDFQAMKWVAPPCILSKITLQNFPRGLDLVPGNAVGHPLPKAATPNAPPHAAIKALCAVLHGDRERRDSGLALFEAFDSIDLMAIQDVSAIDAAVKKVGRVQVMVERIHAELYRVFPQKMKTKESARLQASGENRNVFEIPIGHAESTKVARQPG
jgi:hypothetical protein